MNTLQVTVLTHQGNARATVLLAIAKENKLDVELVETRPPNIDAEYQKLNPLGRIPTFVAPNGFLLTESIAIAVYCKPHHPSLLSRMSIKLSLAEFLLIYLLLIFPLIAIPM